MNEEILTPGTIIRWPNGEEDIIVEQGSPYLYVEDYLYLHNQFRQLAALGACEIIEPPKTVTFSVTLPIDEAQAFYEEWYEELDIPCSDYPYGRAAIAITKAILTTKDQ